MANNLPFRVVRFSNWQRSYYVLLELAEVLLLAEVPCKLCVPKFFLILGVCLDLLVGLEVSLLHVVTFNSLVLANLRPGVTILCRSKLTDGPVDIRYCSQRVWRS